MTTERPLPGRACQLAELFERDRQLATRLNDAQDHFQAANDRLWWGLHPDGQATIYDEHPAAVDQAFANNRFEVLGATDPLAAVQRVPWQIHPAFIDYQTAAEDRRHLAADVGELTRELVEVRIAAGWTDHDARNADVLKLAGAQSPR